MNLKKMVVGVSAVWMLSYASQNVWADQTNNVQLSINLGGASAGGNAPSTGKWGSSAEIQGTGMIQASPWVAVGAQAGYAKFNLSSPNGVNGDPNSSLTRGVTQLTPEISVGKWLGGSQFSVKPYVIAGAGLYHLSDTVTTTTEITGPCPPTSMPPTTTTTTPPDTYQNGYNDGYQAGLNDGYNSGYSDGQQQGYNNGYQDGYNAGYNDGYNAGYGDGSNTSSTMAQSSAVQSRPLANQAADGSVCTTQSVTSSTSDSDHLGFNMGGGIMVKAGDHLAFGPEIEYHYVDSDFHYMTATAQVSVLF